MGTGIHVTAPRGYMAMRMGQSYTLLRSCRVTQRVLLITFIDAQRGQIETLTAEKSALETRLARLEGEMAALAARLDD